MPYTTLDDLSQALSSFFNGEWPLVPPPADQKVKWAHYETLNDQAKFVAEQIMHFSSHITPMDRLKLLAVVEERVYPKAAMNDPKGQRQDKLKVYLRSETQKDWKVNILGDTCLIDQKIRYNSFKFNNHADQSVQLDSNRFFKCHGKARQAHDNLAWVGSNFTTNRKDFVKEESHLLDAYTVAYTHDRKHKANGVIFAIGDGAGGHVDAQQDQSIAQLTYLMGKHAIRLFSVFEEIGLLKENLFNILTNIQAEMRLKRNYESASLLCVRAFPIADGYHLIGFNVGDGLLACWHPKDKQLHTLVPALRLPGGSPPLLPNGYHKHEVQLINCIIPFGDILLPMTDGVYDTLPTTTKSKVDDSKRESQEIYLDNTLMQKELQVLPENCSVEQLLTVLMNISVKNVDDKRSRLTQTKEVNQPIVLGDDLAIGALRMSEKIESSHHFWKGIKNFLHLNDDKGSAVSMLACGPGSK